MQNKEREICWQNIPGVAAEATLGLLKLPLEQLHPGHGRVLPGSGLRHLGLVPGDLDLQRLLLLDQVHVLRVELSKLGAKTLASDRLVHGLGGLLQLLLCNLQPLHEDLLSGLDRLQSDVGLGELGFPDLLSFDPLLFILDILVLESTLKLFRSLTEMFNFGLETFLNIQLSLKQVKIMICKVQFSITTWRRRLSSCFSCCMVS